MAHVYAKTKYVNLSLLFQFHVKFHKFFRGLHYKDSFFSPDLHIQPF